MSRNPQAQQMADESMVRNLAAQASAIWPQEERLFDRYALPAHARIADIGCGSGEITMRLARRYGEAEIVGVDVLEGPLAYARERYDHLAPRVHFRRGDAFELPFDDGAFDLVVCRHVTQAVPEPEKILAELVRVCKPGGWVHVLSEDYGMLHFPEGAVDPDRLWHEAVHALSRATGVDERIGRRTWSLLRHAGLVDLHVDYVIVDTLRVPRETFAEILRAWRDGYAELLDAKGGLAPGEARALFDGAVHAILDPDAYAAWHVPIVGGRRAPVA